MNERLRNFLQTTKGQVTFAVLLVGGAFTMSYVIPESLTAPVSYLVMLVLMLITIIVMFRRIDNEENQGIQITLTNIGSLTELFANMRDRDLEFIRMYQAGEYFNRLYKLKDKYPDIPEVSILWLWYVLHADEKTQLYYLRLAIKRHDPSKGPGQ